MYDVLLERRIWNRSPRSVVVLATSLAGMYTSGAASTDPFAALLRSAIGSCSTTLQASTSVLSPDVAVKTSPDLGPC